MIEKIVDVLIIGSGPIGGVEQQNAIDTLAHGDCGIHAGQQHALGATQLRTDADKQHFLIAHSWGALWCVCGVRQQ